MSLRILFHAPCFDGLVSAALAADLLSAAHASMEFQPVGYGVRASWIASSPPSPFAVVDFLYHPGASFWADHHPTAFVSADAEAHATKRARAGEAIHYDPTAPSCGALLFGLLPRASATPRRARLAAASRRTDAAEYSSPEEALFGSSPEFMINRALGAGIDSDDLVSLVNDLRQREVADVAGRSDVAAWVREVDRRARQEIDRVARDAVVRHGVVVYETESADGTTPARYAPYAIHGDADYSVTLTRWPGGAKVTAMRNPWKDFQGVHIGPLLAKWGGGGHARVGSLLLGPREAADADAVVNEVVAALARRPGS